MTPKRSRCYRCVNLTRQYDSRYCLAHKWILARNRRIPPVCGSKCKSFKRAYAGGGRR